MSDLISREDTIADLHTADIPDEWMVWMENFINAQPSVKPERKPGKWVHMVGWWECNQCHAEYTDMPTCMGKVIYEYCPMCGAKMEVDNG